MKPKPANKEKHSCLTQEAWQGNKGVKGSLIVGIPKENQDKEKRIVLTPEAVDMLVDAGCRVLIEKGAGHGIQYADTQYADSGAEIITEPGELWTASDLVCKISPPTLEEIAWMQPRQTVCSMLQMSLLSIETVKAMMEKRITAIGYELISSQQHAHPVHNSIAEIEGAAAITVAAELLSNVHGGKGVLMGGIPGVSPIDVVILGAGIGGRTAARAALGLGASVKVFDSEICKLRETQEALGQTLFTSVFQPHVVANAFKTADVVIGAMRYIDAPVRYIFTEEMVSSMKKGSLIIDLRVNQGGCFETTSYLPKDSPDTFERFGVLHYCPPNLSSRVARTTSMALSNIFTPLLTQMNEKGKMYGSTHETTGLESGVYLYTGKLVNAYVGKYFGLPFNEIGLFLSSY